MNRCATCKWWRLDDPEPTRFPYYNHGAIFHIATQCKAIEGPDYDWQVSAEEKRRQVEQISVRFCTRVGTTETLPERGGAVALDGENYWSALITDADFGCVRHEPVHA